MLESIFRKKGLSLLSTLLLILILASGCTDKKQNPERTSSEKATPSTYRTITYYDGQTITVPSKINRVASGWNAQNSVIAMLGYGDKIVATTEMIKASPTFRKFVPSIKDAVACYSASGELNHEGLLTAKPDVAFMTSSGTRTQQLREMGIPVAFLKGNSLKNLVDRTVITGKILGDDAYRHALQYVEYFNGNVRKVSERISKIPRGQRLKVYHCMGKALMTQGAPSLVQDWMDLAGAINIARDWNLAKTGVSGLANASIEQIIAADPDVIICMNAADVQAIKADRRWNVVRAVKEDRIYVNPKGLFVWCRETTEEALQFLWLAKTLYPDSFRDIDMAKETKYFYKTFYRIDLSEEDVRMFLNPS